MKAAWLTVPAQQAVDGDPIAVSDVHLAVCYCRNSELHRAACRISVPCCLRAVLPLKRSELLFVILSM